jgi:hypothetical protein
MAYRLISNGPASERPNPFAKYVPQGAQSTNQANARRNQFQHLTPKNGDQHLAGETGKKRYRLISDGNRFAKYIPQPQDGGNPVTLDIGGRRVQVGPEFLQLTRQQQDQTVDEIATELGIKTNSDANRFEKYATKSQNGEKGMTVFELQTPDGQEYEVEAPDENSALEALQLHLHSATDSETDPRFEGSARNPTAGKRSLGETDFNSDLYSPILEGASLSAADEVLTGISAPINAVLNKFRGGPQGVSENYQQTRARYERDKAYAQEQHPVATTVGELAGGLATGKLPASFVTRGRNVLTKAVRGAGVGAGYGAVQGFNSGNGFDDRLNDAVSGAQVGAAVGGVLAPVAQGVGKGYQAVTSRFGSDSRNLAKDAGVKSKVFRRVAKAYGDDAETGMLAKADDADMLLNSGPQLQAFAENIASQPGQGRNVLIRAIGEQSRGAGRRTADVVNRTMGKDAGRVTNANALETERKAAGRLFEVARAYTGKFDVSGLRDNLTARIRETDGPVRSALLKARNLNVFSSENAGVSAIQLHAARQAIDDQLTRPGVGSNAARLLREVRSQIDETLKGHVPGMREADQAYSSVMKRKEALEAGREVFRRSYGSPQELAFDLRNMAPAERADFVKGARDSIAEIMGSARNDAGAARRELLEKGWNREKLQILVGKDTAAVLSNALDKEAARFNAANNILGNSRTALRQEARKAFPGGDASTQDYKGTSLYGAALQLGNKAFNVFVGKRRNELSRQAAQLLTRKAREVEPLLQEAQRLAKRRLNVREQIEIVGNALAVGMIAAR